MLIDTHSHLDTEDFVDDLEETLQRAKDARVGKILIPGICLKDTPHLISVCKSHPDYLYPMIGLHPENIMDEDYHHALAELEKMIIPSGAIAIGEIGLDLYWDDTHKAEQIDAFETQIGWAEKYDLPLMIHCRNAHKEMMEILSRHDKNKLSGVFHCFTGTEEEACELLTFPNFKLGIGGVLTFKKSNLPNVIEKAVPLSRIVIETDSPYMAPTPNRGKRNESAYVKFVAEKLSEIFNTDFNDIAQKTTANTAEVFKKLTFFTEK